MTQKPASRKSTEEDGPLLPRNPHTNLAQEGGENLCRKKTPSPRSVRCSHSEDPATLYKVTQVIPALPPGPHLPLPSPAPFTPVDLAHAYHSPRLLKALRNPTGDGGEGHRCNLWQRSHLQQVKGEAHAATWDPTWDPDDVTGLAGHQSLWGQHLGDRERAAYKPITHQPAGRRAPHLGTTLSCCVPRGALLLNTLL